MPAISTGERRAAFGAKVSFDAGKLGVRFSPIFEEVVSGLQEDMSMSDPDGDGYDGEELAI